MLPEVHMRMTPTEFGEMWGDMTKKDPLYWRSPSALRYPIFNRFSDNWTPESFLNFFKIELLDEPC